KLYYVFGQFSRFIEAGAVRVQTTASEPSLGVAAFRANGKLAIVVVNNTSSPQNGVSFNLLSLPRISSMDPIRTSNTESWAAQAQIAVTASTFSADFPPRSITTLLANGLPITDGGVLGDGDGGVPNDGATRNDGGSTSGNGASGGCGCELGGRPRRLPPASVWFVIILATWRARQRRWARRLR